MIYPNDMLTSAQEEIVPTDVLPEVALTVALAPVVCRDCEQWVPLGWVLMGTVKCPASTGYRHSHAASNEVISSTRDAIINSAI